MHSKIEYKINSPMTTEQFKEVLLESNLARRRPIEDYDCLTGMITNSNLVVSAWEGEKVVGVARSVTDFHYACYLSDLAVIESHQNQGIGKKLQNLTMEQLGEHCKLILLAAPDAHSYYEQLGFEAHPRAWVLAPNRRL